MAVPSEKHPAMEAATDNITQALFGRKRTDSIKQDICVDCGKPASEFNDELSRREFSISGLCQSCQDKVFGSDE